MFKVLMPTACCFLISACSDPCANTIVSRVPSPDGRREAVLFQRDCGATTGFSTQISILNGSQQLTGGGNAFSADDNHGAAQAESWGGSWADLKWSTPDRLIVRYAAKSRLFKQDESVSGVQIVYQSVGS